MMIGPNPDNFRFDVVRQIRPGGYKGGSGVRNNVSLARLDGSPGHQYTDPSAGLWPRLLGLSEPFQ
jgi:hypothetical protein